MTRKGRRYVLVLEPFAPEAPVVPEQAASPVVPEQMVGLTEAEEIAKAIEEFPLTRNPFEVLLDEAELEETAIDNCYQPPPCTPSLTMSQLVDVGRAAAVLGGLTAALVGFKTTEMVIKGFCKAGSSLAGRLF